MGVMSPDPLYDHSRKAGNPGDLFKHVLLAHLLVRLMANHPRRAFRYAESHTGYPLYRLREGGAWRRGAGRLVEAPGTGSPLYPYWCTALGGRGARAGGGYPGSSELARRLILAAGFEPVMWLWDHSPDVVRALRAHYAAEGGVRVMEGEGGAGVATLERADLVLVDPVTLETERLWSTLRHLDAGGIPFLGWVPRRGTRAGEEGEESHRFRERARGCFAVEGVRWEPWREHTGGSLLVASSSLREELAVGAASLREATGWAGE